MAQTTRSIRPLFKHISLVIMVCIASTWPDLATAGEKGLVAQSVNFSPVQLQNIWQVYQSSLSKEEVQRIESLRLIAIEERNDVLQGELTSESTIQVYLQLANLYFEEGHYLYYNEITKTKADIDLCINTLGCDIKSIKSNHSESKKYLDRSISLYNHVITYTPSVSYADEALFYMGQALYDIGEVERAMGTFQKLASTYPESVYIADTNIFIGEYWFENHDYLKAIKAYHDVIAYKSANYYGFALYKLSWSYYNAYKYDEAIVSINLVIDYLNMPKQPNGLVCDVSTGIININMIGCYISNIHKYEYTPNAQVNMFLLNAAQKDKEIFYAAKMPK